MQGRLCWAYLSAFVVLFGAVLSAHAAQKDLFNRKHLTKWLGASHVLLPKPLLDVGDLPPFVQDSQRLLAAITARRVERAPLVQKSLHAYVEACEMGYEVHVVFFAFSVWEQEDDNPFTPWSLYHCKRLEQDLPVAATLSHPNDLRLASRHRELFATFVDRYNLFVSQEEDIDFRPSHLAYFSRWLRHFQDANISNVPILPGLILFEVASGQPGTRNDPSAVPAVTDDPRAPTPPPSPWPPEPPASLQHFHPMLLIHKNHDPMEMFAVNGVICVFPWKMFSSMYIVPKRILKAAVQRPSWTTDVYAPWQEYDVHFTHHWLMHHVRMAIPLVAYRHSLLHHGSDRYSGQHVIASTNNSDAQSHADVMEASELQVFLARCSGEPLVLQRSARPIHANIQQAQIEYDIKDARIPTQSAAPCIACLKQGLGAHFVLRMMGPSPVANAYTKTVRMVAEIKCVEKITQQRLEPCRFPGMCGPGEVGQRRRRHD